MPDESPAIPRPLYVVAFTPAPRRTSLRSSCVRGKIYGWIVDITANQFVAKVEEPVLSLHESGWHRTWTDHQTSGFSVGVSHYFEESGEREGYARLCALADGFSRPA